MTTLIAATIILAIVAIVISGCSTSGKGRRTLIREQSGDPQLIKYFPDVVVSPNADIAKSLTRKSAGDDKDFKNYLTRVYGVDSWNPASLDVAIRDRSSTPAFLPVQAKLPDKVLDLIYSDTSKLPLQQRVEIEESLRASSLNKPDMVPRTALHHFDNHGRKIYYTYPRIYLEISSDLISPRNEDQFSSISVVVKLKDQRKNDHGDAVRFLDYWPKGADLVEYTRGKFTQEAQLSAKSSNVLTDSDTVGGTTSTGPPTALVGTSNSNVDSLASTNDLGYTYTETYVRELLDSFERRTTGVFDDGQVFRADFRSTPVKRVGGTYTFDLMLEVPTNAKNVPDGKEKDESSDSAESSASAYYESKPVLEEIIADVYMVAVVRHISKRGRTGALTRVRDASNDHVFEQVVSKTKADVSLWKWNNLAWVQAPLQQEAPKFKVTVRTNRSDATFAIVDTNGDKVLGVGSGSSASVTIPPPSKTAISAKVKFLSIVSSPKEGPAVVLDATDSAPFDILPKKAGAITIIGDYSLPP